MLPIPFAAQLLMNDPKEAAEHATIVDLIRNDLSMVANQVSVSRYRYMDTLQTNQGRFFRQVLKFKAYCRKIIRNIWENLFSDFASRFHYRCPKEKNDADYSGS